MAKKGEYELPNGDPNLKRCPDCNTVKPLSEFHKSTATSRGVAGQCKACKKERSRAARAAWTGAFTEADVARFMARLDKRPDGCWNFTGHVRPKDGYGQMSFAGRTLAVQQIALMIAGRPAPKGWLIDHTCMNKICGNADHLRVVDPRTSAIENCDSPVAANAAKTHCTKCGSAYEGTNLALYWPKRAVNRHGNERPVTQPQRVCLTCRPHYWKWAVIPRARPTYPPKRQPRRGGSSPTEGRE